MDRSARHSFAHGGEYEEAPIDEPRRRSTDQGSGRRGRSRSHTQRLSSSASAGQHRASPAHPERIYNMRDTHLPARTTIDGKDFWKRAHDLAKETIRNPHPYNWKDRQLEPFKQHIMNKMRNDFPVEFAEHGVSEEAFLQRLGKYVKQWRAHEKEILLEHIKRSRCDINIEDPPQLGTMAEDNFRDCLKNIREKKGVAGTKPALEARKDPVTGRHRCNRTGSGGYDDVRGSVMAIFKRPATKAEEKFANDYGTTALINKLYDEQDAARVGASNFGEDYSDNA